VAWLRSLLRRGPPVPPRDHPLFGRIAFSRHDGWRNPAFGLWGHSPVDLLIDAPAAGPTREQEEAFVRFRDARATLWSRCLDAVVAVRREMGASEGAFSITGLSIPALGATRSGRLWTLWFDCAGDEHFWYGVQSDDDWQTLAGFADD
jgi:hypothetical protein